MAKILFVNAPRREERVEGPSPFSNDRGGLRLAGPAAYLRQEGVDVGLIDASVLNWSLERTAQQAADAKADLVVIATNPYSIGTVAALSSKIKHYHNGVMIALEGPFVESAPQAVLETYRSVDFGLVGDAETTLTGLARCVGQWDQALAVPGLAQRDFGHVVVTESSHHPPDPDTLPLPAWDLLPDPVNNYRPAPPMGNGRESMCVLTSRSTPNAGNGANRPAPRSLSAPRIFDIVRHLIRAYAVTDLAFIDASFLLDEKRVVELCQSVIRESLPLTWSCAGMADHYISDFSLKRMADAGCRQIMLQIDSGADAILARIGGGVTSQEIRGAVERVKKAGIEAHGLFTIGVPGETEATLAQTERFIVECGLDHVVINFYRPPVAAMGRIESMGVRLDTVEPSGDIIHFLPRGLSKDMLAQARERMFKSFYKRAHAPRVRPWDYEEGVEKPGLFDAALRLLGGR